MKPPRQLVARQSVQRKDVQPNMSNAGLFRKIDLDFGLQIHKLAQVKMPGTVCMSVAKTAIFRHFLFQDCHQTRIIPARHTNINIIIPGNKPFVTQHADQRAAGKIISQVVLIAQLHKNSQQRKCNLLYLFQVAHDLTIPDS